MNYAIFRSEPIYTLSDLAQIGSHNKREKKAYNSNPDIKLELSKNNIQLVPLNKKYVKGFYELTKEYKKEYEARMKHERPDRKRTFKQMLDRSKNVVADELLFTVTSDFFKNMNRDDIKKWADTCMEFVYKDLGYTKDQVLHSVVHMDEKTPHIHCVVVPLIRKYDKRAKREKYTISKKYSKGIMTTLTKDVVNKGYHYFDWNVDSDDAGGARNSKTVYNNVVKNLSKNRANVILMHDIKPQTRDALKSIIQFGKNNGYSFDKITMSTPMVTHGVNN